MRKFTALILMGLLTGCSVNAPQSAQYNAEYSQRQDIHTQNVYRFKIKPLQPSGGKYWGADNLTQVFYVSDKNAAAIELRFNFPTATLQASSLDEQGKVVSTQTFALLAESATPPSGSDTKYLYLTKSGELLSKWKNCTPDMSVGCSWGGHQIFITHSADLAVQYATGGAGLAFLLIPFYNSEARLQIFAKAPIGAAGDE
ncbi:hypothetical protein [Klebsiella aerogenes]|uniref:hypothetical protein n=1 Tax=Klebsiella aerogenes TaxID=548 RepID=UPI001D186D16|nr:hypothetical protein [Klebsiella aerogenes]